MPFGKSSKGFKVSTDDPEATETRATDRRETKLEQATQTWLHTKEEMLSGVLFEVEYLGCDEVKEPTGRQNSSEIIERLIQKREGKQVTLRVSANGLNIETEDFDQDHPMKFVQMYRISFTTVDKIRRRVFFFIGRDKKTKKLLMHILQCKTKRQASEVTLSAAQGFQIAFELFEKRDPEAQELLKERATKEETTDNPSEVKRTSKRVSVVLRHKTKPQSPQKNTETDGLVDQPDEDIREEYKRMTILRDNPNLPDMGFDPNDFNDDIALFLAGGLTADEMNQK